MADAPKYRLRVVARLPQLIELNRRASWAVGGVRGVLGGTLAYARWVCLFTSLVVSPSLYSSSSSSYCVVVGGLLDGRGGAGRLGPGEVIEEVDSHHGRRGTAAATAAAAADACARLH